MSSVAVGTAAALSRLAGLNAGQTAHAMALAAYGAPPPLMHRAMTAVEIPESKYDPLAAHTRAAFEAVDLASAGVRGDLGAVEGDLGLWRLFGTAGFDEAAALLDLGRHWYLDNEVWFKVYPVVLYSNPIMEAMAALSAKTGWAADEITQVRIERWNPKPGETRATVATESDAWLSIPVNAALSYLGGAPVTSWRRPEVFAAEPATTLASKIVVTDVSDEVKSQRGTNGLWNGWSPYSVVILTDTWEERIDGSGLRRYPDTELRSKWLTCLRPTFGEGSEAVLTSALNHLDNPRQLMRLFGKEGERS